MVLTLRCTQTALGEVRFCVITYKLYSVCAFFAQCIIMYLHVWGGDQYLTRLGQSLFGCNNLERRHGIGRNPSNKPHSMLNWYSAGGVGITYSKHLMGPPGVFCVIPSCCIFCNSSWYNFGMEINLVNEWTDDVPLFSKYTLLDIGAESVNLTSKTQWSVSFIILGLGFNIFWQNENT